MKTSSSSHPPYLQMINEAIASLKDRNGSSQSAISKFISVKYKPLLPSNFTQLLSAELKTCVESEKITKTRNTYKITTPEKANDLISSSTKESKTTMEVKKARLIVNGKREKMKRLSQVKTPEAMKNVKGKSEKMKRLSQVKTPEALKNVKGKSENMKRTPEVLKNEKGKREKMKRLSQVKTPEALKKKTIVKLTPARKKIGQKK